MADDEITLRDGRSIHLRELHQFGVYEGLLEGLPTAERNPARVARIVESARTGARAEVFLVAPTETPIPVDAPYPFGTPSSLPPIACIGRFWSHRPARDEQADDSWLTIVWFQERFALPIDPDVLERIRDIDWNAHGIDDCY